MRLVLAAAVILCTSSLCCAKEMSCHALVADDDGDLYLVSETADARPVQLTNDGQYKFGAALDPRAGRVAFLYQEPRMEVEVVAMDGHRLALPIPEDPRGPGTPITTHWDSDELLAIGFHGHLNGPFEWLALGKARAPSNVRPGDRGFRLAVDCASAPAARHIACVSGNLIVIDDSEGVNVDPFERARTLGTFKLAAGETLKLPGYEGASMTVVGIQHGGTQLRVELGDSQPESFLELGSYFYARIGTSAWGDFSIASMTTGPDSSAKTAQVVVRVLDVEELPEVQPALAWSSDGATLAAVRTEPWSSSELWLIKQRKGRGWAAAQRLDLKQKRGVYNLKFVGPSAIYVQGTDDMAVYSIRDDHLELLKALPSTLSLSDSPRSEPTSVLDWSCVQ